MATKIDKTLAGSQVTDELQNSLGASEYGLDHDTFFGSTDFDIYTAAASGGTHLVENTHYTLHDEDTDLTTEASKTVYTTVKITDPTYQACDLYFTYKTVGDYNEAADVNVLTDMLSKSADYTIKDHDRNPTILVTTAAADKTITLPTAADNSGKTVMVIKADSGAADVIIDGEGAETINGATTLTLVDQWSTVTLRCDGTSWNVIAGNVAKNIAKAWVNFNGTGTVAIRDDYNVSSITDHGTGLYTVNFTNAMSDTNYSTVITGRRTTTTNVIGFLKSGGAYSTTAVQIEFERSTEVNVDVDIACVQIFGS